MIYEVPLSAIPSQSFEIILNEQECNISVYLRGENLYFDLMSNGVQIVVGQICLNKVKLIPYRYMNFVGNLMFYDNQGMSDPIYNGLGNRYSLLYWDGNVD